MSFFHCVTCYRTMQYDGCKKYRYVRRYMIFFCLFVSLSDTGGLWSYRQHWTRGFSSELPVSQQLIQTDCSGTGICLQTQPWDQNSSEGQHNICQPAGFQIQEMTWTQLVCKCVWILKLSGCSIQQMSRFSLYTVFWLFIIVFVLSKGGIKYFVAHQQPYTVF